MSQHTAAYVSIRQHTLSYVSTRQHTSTYVSIRRHTHTHTHTDSGVHVGLQSGKSALQLAEANGKSEVLKVLCEHGARGALCYAAKNDLRDMVAELISKGHDLAECDQVHFSA